MVGNVEAYLACPKQDLIAVSYTHLKSLETVWTDTPVRFATCFKEKDSLNRFTT